MTIVCPCGSQILYDDCCGQYISSRQTPKTAEALMRSRYSAYTLGNISYIKKTMKGKPLDNFNEASALLWAKSVYWLGLEILDFQTNLDQATVLFIASYVSKSKVHYLKEKSSFQLIENQWFYTDGQLFELPSKPISLNGFCYCGSGKKFKNCHAKC